MTFALPLLAIPSIAFTEGLSIVVPGGARSAVRIDPVEYALNHGALTPVAGEKLGNGTWTVAKAGADGSFTGQAAQRGYFYFRIESPRDAVMALTESGDNMVFVNGEARVGDVYMNGYVTIPVKVRKGANEFLFSCGRGKLTAKLDPAPGPVSIDLRDATTPDVIPTDHGPLLAAAVFRNATEATVRGAMLVATADGLHAETRLPDLPAVANFKAGFSIPPAPTGKIKLELRVAGKTTDVATLTVRVRKAGESFKRTFRSAVDGSVQYFGVQPSTNPAPGQALFLSLHGAGVEAIGQADAYSPKSWGTIVAATNRRPFGFDWEDVGRLDAMEVLGVASSMFRVDPTKTYLTGHSMGGHGTWQVGVQFPDRFAALGPSAGWISFATYAGGARFDPEDPIDRILRRASSASDTLSLANNYKQEAIYILHGDADDNVPVEQARTMRKELSAFHHDFDWYEQPGAGHWWDASNEPGADCVDWAPMFDLFARRRKPDDAQVRSIDFTCAEPGVSGRCHWLTVVQQLAAFVPSRVQVRLDPFSKRYVGTTQNVRALAIRLPQGATGEYRFELDGKTISCAAAPTVWLIRTGEAWRAERPALEQKNPDRSGGFKSVFSHDVTLVYGTHGTAEENAWAYAKARFDSETMWYRGNASLMIVSDEAWKARKEHKTNVVLYGNRRSNSAWVDAIDGVDFDVDGGRFTAGERSMTGSIGVIAIRPMKGSIDRSVGIVGGTDLLGMKTTTRSPYFLSGSGYPDFLVLSPETLKTGVRGVLGAGFFGNDWTVRHGEAAWRP